MNNISLYAQKIIFKFKKTHCFQIVNLIESILVLTRTGDNSDNSSIVSALKE